MSDLSRSVTMVGGLLGMISLLLLASCSSIYLHDDKTETLTQTAKDDLGQMKLDQYFADERLQLANFAVREDQVVAAYMIASRDQQFSNLVRDNVLVDDPPTPTKQLQELVSNRFKEIIGHVPKRDQLNDLATFPRQLDLIREGRESSKSFYRGALKDFATDRDKDDKRPVQCTSVPQSAEGLPEASAGDFAYLRLVEACAGIKEADEEDESIRAQLMRSSGPETLFAQVIANEDDAIAKIDAQEAEAARVKKLLNDIQNDASTPGAQDVLKGKIEELKELLKQATGFTKLAGAEGISETLEQLLAADLQAESASEDDEATEALTRQASAVLKLTDALAQASDAFAEEPRIKRINSVLIALVEQRQKLDLAKLEISHQNDLLRIYEAEEAALVQELAQLSITQRVLDRALRGVPIEGPGGGFAAVPPGPAAPGQAVGTALAAYAASWNQGQIPFRVLQFKEVQVDRAYHVQSAAKTAQNWQSLLEPAIDQLADYGKGGIRLEDIARLITNLGLIAVVGAI